MVEAESQSNTMTRKVRNLLTNSAGSFDKEIQSRIKQVLHTLEYLESKKDILGLKEGGGASGGSVRKFPTTCLVDEAGIYGRNGDTDAIIDDWLLSQQYNSSQLSVLSIMGMGGLGKTTLAQCIYNDVRVQDEFKLKAWVCVSDNFDVTRVTGAIIEAITLSNDDSKDLNVLQNKLKGMLIGKRFLLVLDDLWNEKFIEWEALHTHFKFVASRSKILYALLDGDAPFSNPNFEAIGKKIIETCKGLPLALKTIGSLLYTKSSIEEWNDILKSEVWEEGTNILPPAALRLSYHHLPSLLKRCFAYCSVFPKDYEFSKEHLVELWMAENFFSAQQGKELKDVGDKLFHDLLARSFFQQASGDKMSYIMHDLINDLAKNVSGDFCFMLQEGKARYASKATRHFSYTESIWVILLKNLKLYAILRNCALSGTIHGYANIIELPKSIDNLKHLCYLNISKTPIKRLPDSICLLYNLQTLRLEFCKDLEELPNDLHKLINLQHLDFRETKFADIGLVDSSRIHLKCKLPLFCYNETEHWFRRVSAKKISQGSMKLPRTSKDLQQLRVFRGPK
ncbi:putative disease resistance RPP13-like protein 1 [Prosopis cineraria]|uniref:putative disease resistance RPP13-like protein 1 n=1 Tax=Prosopis cineraria TaxID=364024 RepID=UPI00240EBC52|nr:putative disease resistance RPP13-like protein 1 [Prosopis cineraria]